MLPKTVTAIFLTLLVMELSACSPGYVMRAAYEQSKILLARENISAALADPEISSEIKEKLTYVLEARQFAKDLGLEPHDSYTKYAPIDKEALTWVVMGCQKDSFTLHTWWFPIVGTLPYKGFFDKQDAMNEAKGLAANGYETWVRGSDAFSTLGWFNDPVLTTTLRHPIPSIVDTVIHELVHSNFWFKGSVDFNESLANFIAMEATPIFFDKKAASCGETSCRDTQEKFRTDALQNRLRTLDTAAMIDGLYQSLDALYRSNKSRDEKLKERETLFEDKVKPLRARFPTMKFFTSINNAEIMQLKIYLTRFEIFSGLFDSVGGDVPKFVALMQEIYDSYTRNEATDPFGEASKKLADKKQLGTQHDL